MRAIVVRAIGGPEVLELADVPEPSSPAPGEVLVKIEAVGVNFADTERRRGIYSAPPDPLPAGSVTLRRVWSRSDGWLTGWLDSLAARRARGAGRQECAA